ncbi:hypothetical protein [Sphingobacterium humi]|uniref:Uncharacterized protein n=1 Tax=Sphingobacterium humi TaxID=1796905 RepID=A0A6N8L3V9_9SPHI|nr:hypothetical protein [Sphingobacterium humi]MVZ63774.1 hypothetical protein [Sphingobacterium humi]
MKLNPSSIKSFKNGIPTLIGFIVLIVVFIKYDFDSKEKEKNLRKNFLYSVGKITDVMMPGRSSGSFTFKYFILDKQYENDYSPGSRRAFQYFNFLSQYEWPMIYDSTDFSNATLLLQKSDYEKYGIPYNGQRVVDFNKMIIIDSNQIIKLN